MVNRLPALRRRAAPAPQKGNLSNLYAIVCVGCSGLDNMGTSGMGLVLGGRRQVVLTGHADASWADDQATQRSSQGYTFSLGSGSVSWRSTRSSSTRVDARTRDDRRRPVATCRRDDVATVWQLDDTTPCFPTCTQHSRFFTQPANTAGRRCANAAAERPSSVAPQKTASHIDFRIPTQSRLRHRDLDDVRVSPQNSPSRLPGRPPGPSGRPPGATGRPQLPSSYPPGRRTPSIDQNCQLLSPSSPRRPLFTCQVNGLLRRPPGRTAPPGRLPCRRPDQSIAAVELPGRQQYHNGPLQLDGACRAALPL
ncbi:unnamed protein product [Closterium sp. NIES-53]